MIEQPTNLLEWVADTSYVEAVIVIMIPALLITIMGIFYVRAVYPPEELSASQVASAKIEYMAQVYAVVLGLILVGAFDNYLEMQEAVKTEAFSLRALHNLADSLQEPGPTAVAEQTRKYTKTVITAEWPRMKFGDESHAAQVELDRIFALLSKGGDQGMIHLAQEVMIQRGHRLANGLGDGDTLSQAFAQFLVLLTVIALAIPWFLYTPHPLLHIITGAMMSAVFVAIIVLSIKMLYPFAGELMIHPTEFQHALLDMLEQTTTPDHLPPAT